MEQVRDRRIQPRIKTRQVVMGLFFMLAVRIGSLNGVEQAFRSCGRRTRWHVWLGGDLPSADRLGEVAALTNADDVRAVLHAHYAQRRRKKTLTPLPGGLRMLILDGHEMFASYLKSCPDCLEREITFKEGVHTQYYHRYVAAFLLCGSGRLLLDLELQHKGEGEIAAATRLLERLFQSYPRAFDLVAGDALYLDPALCQYVLRNGKDFMAVLKNENRDLIQDFRGLKDRIEPLELDHKNKHCTCRDLEGFNSWTPLGSDVRVVSSQEIATVRRQRTKAEETITSEWLWATSLSRGKAGTAAVVFLGHGRWKIENCGFNEIDTYWHADHLYYHDANAILVILLLLFVTYNVFHAWLSRGIKPQLRQRHTVGHFVTLMAAQFYSEFLHPT